MKKIMVLGFIVLLGVVLAVGTTAVRPLSGKARNAAAADSTPAMSVPKIIIRAMADCRWAQLAMGPDGIAHVCYELDYTGFDTPQSEVWYSNYNGTTNSTPLYLAKGRRPAIASSKMGKIAVVAADATHQVWLKVYDPAQSKWLDLEIVATASYSGFEPQVCFDPDENIYVLFYSDTAAITYARCKINGTWDNVTRVDRGNAKHCAIAAGADGRVWAVWREKIGSGGNYKLVYSKRTKSTSWTTGKAITKTNGDMMPSASASHEHLWVNKDNVCIIGTFNSDESVGFGGEFRVIWFDEVNNLYQTVIDQGLYHYAFVTVDANNYIHAACQVGGGDFGNGVAYVNNFAHNEAGKSTWSAPIQFAGNLDKLPGLAADAYGNVAMVWSSAQDDPSTPDNEASVIFLSSLYPVTPKIFNPPITLPVTITLRSARRTPQINYNLSWSADPANTMDFIQGYRIYLSENGGAFTKILELAKTTNSAVVTFSDLNKKRLFGITTYTASGLESKMVFFQ